jgi:hypothetical protein
MSTIKQSIMDMFELDKMEPVKALEMVERLSRLIFQATLVRVLPLLSEKETAEYEKIVSKAESPELLLKFFEAKVPNFGKIFEEEAEGLRAELAGEFKEAGLQ